MFSSKFTKRLYQASVNAADLLDKLAGTVIVALAVKHVDTMFKEAHVVEDKAYDKLDKADILAAASHNLRHEGHGLDLKAGQMLREAEQEALELGVSLSRWA